MQDKKNYHLHMNPGAAGISGFHKIRTLLRFSNSFRRNKKFRGH